MSQSTPLVGEVDPRPIQHYDESTSEANQVAMWTKSEVNQAGKPWSASEPIFAAAFTRPIVTEFLYRNSRTVLSGRCKAPAYYHIIDCVPPPSRKGRTYPRRPKDKQFLAEIAAKLKWDSNPKTSPSPMVISYRSVVGDILRRVPLRCGDGA